MSKVYLHVHRGDRPGKCYWVAHVAEGFHGLHPDFAHAEPIDEKNIPEIAAKMCAQFQTYMEFVGVQCEQPGILPDSIRSLVRL